jgi:hypothetical protein
MKSIKSLPFWFSLAFAFSQAIVTFGMSGPKASVFNGISEQSSVMEAPLSPDRLLKCIEHALHQHGDMASSMHQQDRQVITTPFKWVSADGLKKIARPERISAGKWIGGRYRVVFIIARERGGHSRLTIIPEIFGEPAPGPAKTPQLMGPVGGPMRGVAVGSNGALERRWLEIVKQNCGG